MRKHLERFLAATPRKIVNTFDLEQYVIQVSEEDYQEEEFCREINLLVDEGVLLPVTSRQEYEARQGLYSGYRKGKPVPSKKEKWLQRLQDLHPLISTEYYREHPDQISADFKYIAAIDAFFKERADAERVTVQQRSFHLFCDEGFLTRRKGQVLLQRLRLDYADLACFQPAHPFVYSVNCPEGDSNHILLVEGEDSFHTIRKLMLDERDHLLQNRVSLLIFGDGDQIESRLEFFEELIPFQSKQNIFYYFGDLSYERFHFIRRIQRHYPRYDIRPCVPLYSELAKACLTKAVAQRRWVRERGKEEDVRDVLAFFPGEVAALIDKLFCAGKYIPQVALSRRSYEKILKAEETKRPLRFESVGGHKAQPS